MLTPASFGCAQILVWLAIMNGKTLLEINFLSAGTDYRDPWPSSSRMIGPQLFGRDARKGLTYIKNVSWVIERVCNVRIFIPGESLKASLNCGAAIASMGVSPLCCLSLLSASFAFIFDLLVWMKRGAGAPSMSFSISRKAPMGEDTF